MVKEPQQTYLDSAMNLSAQEIFETPAFFHFAFEGDRSLFLRMDREAYFRSIFLDGRIQATNPDPIRLATAPLARWRGEVGFPSKRVNWIFHTAHCGSTLLARALDRLGASLVLREPISLRQLGVWRAMLKDHDLAWWDAKLELTVAQLGKRYQPHLPVIVKANVPVNFILPRIMALDPGTSAILLYYPLRQYLLAVLRTETHRQWVNRVTDEMRPALVAVVGDLEGLDTVERAAALWLAQLRAFAAVLDAFPGARSLSAETLFVAPRDAISAAAALFDVALDDFELDAIIGSSLFTNDAKDPTRQFDRRARQMQVLLLESTLERELERAREWVERKLALLPLSEKLPRPLTGASPPLL